MKLFYSILSLLCVLSLPPAYSQESDIPNIAYVYPAGVQRGSTAKFVIGGRGFKNARAILVTGGGLKASMGEITIPCDRNTKNGLMNRLEKKYLEESPELRAEVEKLGGIEGQRFLRNEIKKDPENIKKFNEIDESYHLRIVSSDALAETVEFELTADADAPIGERRLFLVGPYGVSNPIVFMVGSLPEFSKPSLRETARERAKNEKNKGKLIWGYMNKSFLVPEKSKPMEVKIPCVVNGQITEAKTDRYVFEAKKGQKIVAALAARQLIPYISDAVPGWFQAVLKIFDSKGKELAYNDDFFHRPDPYLLFEVPEDGKYTVEINDAIYRSREDFVYRLTLGEVPFVKSLFPLFVSDAGETELRVEGDNLPSDTIRVRRNRAGEFLFERESLFHNRIQLMATQAPSILSDSESAFLSGVKPDLLSAAPQKISAPICVDGVIRRPFQCDSYKITLAQGEQLLFETFARRLDSPLDSYLSVSDSSGKILAFSDDYEDASCPYVTHHADSKILFAAPYTGEYIIRVRDASDKYSPYHAYRLYAGPAKPDFKLISERSSVNLSPGATDSFTVKLHRQNGFDGNVKIRAKGLPKGWKIAGAEIPRGADCAEITLTAPDYSPKEIFYPQFFGESGKGALKITRKMVPADNMMQAFYYWHQVPSQTFRVYVRKSVRFGGQFKTLSLTDEFLKEPLKIPLDKPIDVRVGSAKNNKGIWMLVPESDTASSESGLKALKLYKKGGGIYVQLEAKNIAPGTKGRLVLSVYVKRGSKRFLFGKVPSLEYEVVDKLPENPRQIENKTDPAGKSPEEDAKEQSGNSLISISASDFKKPSKKKNENAQKSGGKNAKQETPEKTNGK